jgi:hypothetical protein
MKKLLPIVISILIVLACAPAGQQLTAPAVPGVETIVALTIEALTALAPPATDAPTVPPPPPSAQPNGTAVSYGNVSFFLPKELASNALAGTAPAVVGIADGPGWDVAPEHIKFQLENYALYDTFHEPYILMIPAPEYAAVNEQAAKNIARLQAIISGAAAPTAENLPHVTTFNAGQLFAAQIEIVRFANGSGVRFLTEYGQYFATANNHDLFYQFQGLTSDGKYYILAILPASHPLLAHDEKPETAPPPGGIPFPGYENESALTNYYIDVVNLLNSAAPDSFIPALTNLDALIQSISIAP